MDIIERIRGWFRNMFNRKGIEDAFGVRLAVDPKILSMQKQWRDIARGTAEWNDANTPSLRLANALSTRVARKVVNGLESEITGGVRADYLNEQYKKVIEQLQSAVITACDCGEIVFKPYMQEDALAVTVADTDCYWPVGYDEEETLIDVIFGASYEAGETTYKLLERHSYDKNAKTHEIEYRAYKAEHKSAGFMPEAIGVAVPLTQVPAWAHLRDITIHDVEQPLFVHFKLPGGDSSGISNRYGSPIWRNATDMLRKADLHEARTDWEFEGGELAVDASIEMFKPNGGNKPGQTPSMPELPKGKERLYRTVYATEQNFQMQVFNPEFRIGGLDMRMNQILRRIEFQCGVSYGLISDAGGQDRTAEEFKASKDNFFSTVTDIQRALEAALDKLIYAFDALADLQGVAISGYDVSYTWDDSIMADREVEFQERVQAQAAGWLNPVENRAWYLGLDIESDEVKAFAQEMERREALAFGAGEFN